jgi:hypothetical protein
LGSGIDHEQAEVAVEIVHRFSMMKRGKIIPVVRWPIDAQPQPNYDQFGSIRCAGARVAQAA